MENSLYIEPTGELLVSISNHMENPFYIEPTGEVLESISFYLRILDHLKTC